MSKKKPAAALSDNALAKKALEAIQQIEAEAKEKKSGQLIDLRDALVNIDARIEELQHQRQQVETAIAKITGKPIHARKPRSNYDELRARILRWLASHPGEVYTANDLKREFPELEAVGPTSTFFKAAITEGAILMDKSGGNRNTKYGTKG